MHFIACKSIGKDCTVIIFMTVVQHSADCTPQITPCPTSRIRSRSFDLLHLIRDLAPSLEFVKEPLEKQFFILDLARPKIDLTIAHTLNEMHHIRHFVALQLDAQQVMHVQRTASCSVQTEPLANHSHQHSASRRTMTLIASLNVRGELYSKGWVSDTLISNQGAKVLVQSVQSLTVFPELAKDIIRIT